MNDLVVRLRNNIFASCPCLVCKGALEAADEIISLNKQLQESERSASTNAEIIKLMCKERAKFACKIKTLYYENQRLREALDKF